MHSKRFRTFSKNNLKHSAHIKGNLMFVNKLTTTSGIITDVDNPNYSQSTVLMREVNLFEEDTEQMGQELLTLERSKCKWQEILVSVTLYQPGTLYHF